ncbi:hypothetical protein ACFL57_00010 [Candidatus Margulisiibacteriota bacterium]
MNRKIIREINQGTGQIDGTKRSLTIDLEYGKVMFNADKSDNLFQKTPEELAQYLLNTFGMTIEARDGYIVDSSKFFVHLGFRNKMLYFNKYHNAENSGETGKAPLKLSSQTIRKADESEVPVVTFAGGKTNFRVYVKHKGELYTEIIDTEFAELPSVPKDIESKLDTDERIIIEEVIQSESAYKINPDGNKPEYDNTVTAIIKKCQILRIQAALSKLFNDANISENTPVSVAYTGAGVPGARFIDTAMFGLDKVDVAADLKLNTEKFLIGNDAYVEVLAIAGEVAAAYELSWTEPNHPSVEKYSVLINAIKEGKYGSSFLVTAPVAGTGIGIRDLRITVSEDKRNIAVDVMDYPREGAHAIRMSDSTLDTIINSFRGEEKAFLRNALSFVSKDNCDWCGDSYCFENIASGGAAKRYALFLYDYLLEQGKNDELHTLQKNIIKNHSHTSIDRKDHDKFKEILDGRDLFNSEDKNAKLITELIERLWSTYLMRRVEYGQHMTYSESEGTPITMDPKAVIIGHILAQNTGFVKHVEESFKKDSGISDMDLINAYHPDNQLNGSIILGGR